MGAQEPGESWLHLPVNLTPRRERVSFGCFWDVYNYGEVSAGTLVVDFANRQIGGGCFSGGFVQEGRMVMQSLDLTVRVRKRVGDELRVQDIPLRHEFPLRYDFVLRHSKLLPEAFDRGGKCMVRQAVRGSRWSRLVEVLVDRPMRAERPRWVVLTAARAQVVR